MPSTPVPYGESQKVDLSDYPISPLPSKNVFEQQKHSLLPHDRAIAMQKANAQAADAAVKAINAMASGADILKAYPFIDGFSANKIAKNKPATWHYLNCVLMQRQISELLKFHKQQAGTTPPPSATEPTMAAPTTAA